MPLSTTPALFTKMSTVPKASTVFSMTALHCSLSEISHGTANTSPPAALIFSATSSNCATLLAEITTFAPSLAKSSAVQAPMPEFPPVITATFPFNLSILLPPLYYNYNCYLHAAISNVTIFMASFKHILVIITHLL